MQAQLPSLLLVPGSSLQSFTAACSEAAVQG